MRFYEHGGDIYGNGGIRLDLSVNTNPLGMPDNVKRALASGVEHFSRYPDPHCRALRAAIARREGVPENWILCGNGAVELIHAVCRARSPKRGRVFPPTFSEYQTAMRLAGCRLADDGADIVFICTPNNPTGQLTPVSALKALAQHSKLLVIDECFIDFSDGQSFTRFLGQYPNVAVLKAFTKIYAMAGLRLGYMLCANTALLDETAEQMPVWSVSVPAQIAGAAALENADWTDRTREFISRERDRLMSAMREIVDVTESRANFIFFSTDKPVYNFMLKNGILIRRWDATHYRVAVSTRENNEVFIKWLRQL